MPSKTRTSAKGGGARRRPKKAKAKAMAKNPFAALLSAVRRDIDARLAGFLDAKLEQAKVHGPHVQAMVGGVRDLCLRGGKRTRPALLVAGYRAASAGQKLEPALDAGVALELMHAYFLIHDDWMDRDELRRGGPSVHALLTKHFRSERIGEASAILAGDYAIGAAAEAMARVEMVPSRAQRVLACFAQMQLDAVVGQELDLIGNAKDVEATYELKTGSYTVRGPLRMGALLAGGNPRLLTALDRFALPVGIAYQLRDDLIGAFGEPEQTGKPRGSDLRAGKQTVLLLSALKRASGRDHRILKSVVGDPKASAKDVERAVEVLDRSGARAIVERRIDELVASALVALRAGRLSAEGVSLLEGAARAMTMRRN